MELDALLATMQATSASESIDAAGAQSDGSWEQRWQRARDKEKQIKQHMRAAAAADGKSSFAHEKKLFTLRKESVGQATSRTLCLSVTC